MRLFHFVSLVSLFAVLTCATPLIAEEQYLEFIQGLRDKNYHDTALDYLTQIEKDKETPKEIRELIPFERAMTLMLFSRTQKLPEEQDATLDQALQQLVLFTKQSPNHPKAGTANTERGKIVLEKAEVQIRQADTGDPAKKKEAQAKARKLVAQARAIFQKAYDQHEKTMKSYPSTFIDPQKDKEKFAARAKAEIQFMSAQLDLAQCTYVEAQTYDAGSADYNRLLTKASEEYAKIHERYRSQVGGLFARMWQGKCFEEQGELGRALGIYNEMLAHPGDSPAMKQLQDNVLQFRLICLNDEKRKDYQLVINEAEQWLKDNRARKRTPIGLGITWELARAQESLANQEGLKKTDQERILRQALTNARYVNAFRGKYREVSRLMIGRINAKLQKNSGGDPTDFQTAYGLGQDRVKQAKSLKEKVTSAKTSADKKKAEVELNQYMEETARLLRLALKLADDKTEPKELAQARYFLAYTYYNLRRSYECAILSEYIANNHAEEGSLALDAAYLALAGYLQAYNDSPKEQRYVDNQHMEAICNLIATKWPDSDRANDARIQLGNIYSQTERPVEAAKWYSQVPKTAPQYVEAQIRAGQSYWNSYLTAMARKNIETKPQDINQWEKLAEQHLRTGIAAIQKSIPADKPSPEDLTAAKTSLAQIALNKGNYQEAIDILTKDPHSVLKAIHLAKGQKRPAKGVKSSEFASLVYQLQLRAYIGLQQIDLARQAMKQLEESASGSGGESITDMYRQLGEKITEEIDRLKAAGDTKRIADVRKSLETFLTDIFKRKDQTYGSLVWIGETYYGMGQGASENPEVARGYFEKAAAAFEEIQKRQDASGDFIPGNFQVGITLRLVNCKRAQGDYEEALALITPVLKEKANSPEVQFEAASILQDWAGSGQGDNAKKYLNAISGMELKDGALIRGWAYLARLLQSSAASSGRQDLLEMFYDAQYNKIDARRKYGIAINEPKQLELAKSETNVFGQISVDLPDDVWERFNQLYRQIQTDMGEDPVDLERRVTAPAAVADNSASPLETETPANTQQQVAQQTAKAPAEGGSNTMLFLGVIVLGIGGAVAFYFFGLKPGKKARPSYQLASNVSMPSEIAPPPASAPKPSRSAPSKSAAPDLGLDKPKQKAAPEKEKRQKSADSSESGKEKRKLTPEQIAARKAKLAKMSPEEIAARKAAIAKKKAAQAKQQKQSRPRPDGESKDA